tara:strand:+ start:1162 stop:1680 length:519 start_codon:yes stop_codon:yes gene_type:complete
MANLDAVVPFKNTNGVLTLIDGTGTPNTLAITFRQGTISYSETGRAYVEAMEAGRHIAAAPVLVDTDDGNVTGSFSMLVTSFRGSSAVTPYEFLTFTLGAAAFTTTAKGSKPAIKMTFVVDSTGEAGGSGGSQTITFNYAVINSVDLDSGGADGLFQMSVSFTDHENHPSYA